jgi:hypothetical protein
MSRGTSRRARASGEALSRSSRFQRAVFGLQ